MTLERMFPGRPFLGIGSGEALNEVPVGDDWPPVGDQIARMEEALGYIDRLWKGETITEEGRFFRLRDCKLHTLADRRPPVWVSAFGPQAAEVAGRWGDAVWTLPDPDSTPEVIDAFREARRRAGREGQGEIVLQAMISWAPDEREALEAVRMWKGAQPQDHYTADWHEPRKMYEHGEAEMSDEEFAGSVIAGSEPEKFQERLRELEQFGPTVAVIMNNSADPMRAIEMMGRDVLPELRRTRV
jgi:coenzyme F420-dependent glucose-6-phosphate dehydrogenase